MFQVFLASAILLLSFTSQASLWTAQNAWDDTWEKSYSQWIQSEVTPTYLQDHEISTDCADAVVTLRWIFARENSLPMASNGSGGKLITNQSSAWDSQKTSSDWKQDQRFLKAIRDINRATSSKTLFRDLYPIKLNSANLVGGTVFINATQDSGHAEWIAKVDFNGMNAPLTFFSSTVPQQVREFLVYPFFKIKWPEKNKNGFMRFRWPVLQGGSVQLKSVESMPGYSLEQYENEARENTDFDDYVTTKLIGHPMDGSRKVQVLASHLSERIMNRVPIVEAGYKACGGGQCPNSSSSAFYNHSTYSRDGAIIFLIQGIFDLLYSDRYQLNIDSEQAGQMTVLWSKIQTDVVFTIQGQQLNLGQIVTIWNEAKFSSDPNKTIEQRWGLTP